MEGPIYPTVEHRAKITQHDKDIAHIMRYKGWREMKKNPVELIGECETCEHKNYRGEHFQHPNRLLVSQLRSFAEVTSSTVLGCWSGDTSLMVSERMSKICSSFTACLHVVTALFRPCQRNVRTAFVTR